MAVYTTLTDADTGTYGTSMAVVQVDDYAEVVIDITPTNSGRIYDRQIASGALPTGMSLGFRGSGDDMEWVIYGTPTATGNTTFTLTSYFQTDNSAAESTATSASLNIYVVAAPDEIPGSLTQYSADQLQLLLDNTDITLTQYLDEINSRATAEAATMDTAYLSNEYAIELNLDLLTRKLSIPDPDEDIVPQDDVPEGESFLMELSRNERFEISLGLMKRGVLQDLTVDNMIVTWKMFEPEAVITLGSGTPTEEGTGTNDRRYSLTVFVDPDDVNTILARGTGLERTKVDGFLQIQIEDDSVSPLTIISQSEKVRIHRDH